MEQWTGNPERRSGNAALGVTLTGQTGEDDDAGTALVTSSDASGTIKVSLDYRGRIEAVMVEPGWWRSVPPDGFTAAVVEALVAGLDQLLAARRQGSIARGPGIAPPDALDRVGDLNSYLSEWERRLEEFASHELVIRSAAGHVTVTTRAATFAALEVDEHWLRSARPHDIGQEVSEAFRSAYRAADEVAVPGPSSARACSASGTPAASNMPSDSDQ